MKGQPLGDKHNIYIQAKILSSVLLLWWAFLPQECLFSSFSSYFGPSLPSLFHSFNVGRKEMLEEAKTHERKKGGRPHQSFLGIVASPESLASLGEGMRRKLEKKTGGQFSDETHRLTQKGIFSWCSSRLSCLRDFLVVFCRSFCWVHVFPGLLCHPSSSRFSHDFLSCLMLRKRSHSACTARKYGKTRGRKIESLLIIGILNEGALILPRVFSSLSRLHCCFSLKGLPSSCEDVSWILSDDHGRRSITLHDEAFIAGKASSLLILVSWARMLPLKSLSGQVISCALLEELVSSRIEGLVSYFCRALLVFPCLSCLFSLVSILLRLMSVHPDVSETVTFARESTLQCSLKLPFTWVHLLLNLRLKYAEISLRERQVIYEWSGHGSHPWWDTRSREEQKCAILVSWVEAWGDRQE